MRIWWDLKEEHEEAMDEYSRLLEELEDKKIVTILAPRPLLMVISNCFQEEKNKRKKEKKEKKKSKKDDEL